MRWLPPRARGELPVDFVEEEIESMRLDDEVVTAAAAGTHIGLETGLTKSQARKGARVYRVASHDDANHPAQGV